MKRRKPTLDVDNIETAVAIDGTKILDSSNKNDMVPQKRRHRGHRLKQFFSPAHQDVQPHATLKLAEPSSHSAVATNSTSSGPDINAPKHSSFDSGHQAERQPLRKRDHLRQTFGLHRARPDSQLQNNGVPIMGNNSTSPPDHSDLIAIWKAEMARSPHPDLCNQYCSRSIESSHFQPEVEAAGELETGSTLCETGQPGVSGNSNNAATKLQVYPGEAGKLLFFKRDVSAGKDFHGGKKNHSNGDNYRANNAACSNFDTNVGNADDGEPRTISKYFPSPDTSVPGSPNPDLSKYPGDEDVGMLSSPSNYSTSRSVSTESEFSLPPPASLFNTLGRSGLGIDAGTMKDSNPYRSMRYTELN